MRKEKGREAGKFAGGRRRRRGQLSCSVETTHPGGIWGTCGPPPSWHRRRTMPGELAAKGTERSQRELLAAGQEAKLEATAWSGLWSGPRRTVGGWEGWAPGCLSPGALRTVVLQGLQQGADSQPCRPSEPKLLPGTCAVERALHLESAPPLTHRGIPNTSFFLVLGIHVVPNTILLTAASQ